MKGRSHAAAVERPGDIQTGVRKPTKAELAAAVGWTIPDVLPAGMRVLFCGINPGLYTAAVGHHFARPGNRFWPALFAGGFTDRLHSPFEDVRLGEQGYGFTNLVARATATADELSPHELIEGRRILERKLRTTPAQWLAMLGIGAYRTAFEMRGATVGPQEKELAGARVWVLPNPSGLNAHHQPGTLAACFRALRAAIEDPG